MASGEVTCNSGNITEGLCNNVIGSVSFETAQVEYSDYGYLLTRWTVYLFIAFFTVGAVAHFGLGVWRRSWWTIYTLGFGTCVEVVGWGGRFWSYNDTNWDPNLGGLWFINDNGFIMQICCLVIAPTFFSAANYVLLGKLIAAEGPEYSTVSTRSFSALFILADFLCLVVQGVGGGIAGTAATTAGSNNGGYIMTAGVFLQLFITVIYVILLVEWVMRRRSGSPARKQYHPLSFLARLNRRGGRLDRRNTAPNQIMTEKQLKPRISTCPADVETALPSGVLIADMPFNSHISSSGEVEVAPRLGNFDSVPAAAPGDSKVGLTLSWIGITTLLIVIRSLYRSVELSSGWRGSIATNESLFLGLDALLMLLVVYAYILVHPSFMVPKITVLRR